MAGLPAGVRVTDRVAVDCTAGPHAYYHRPADEATTGCGLGLAPMVGQPVYLAVGVGCLPCPLCWSVPVDVSVVRLSTGDAPLLLRPAVPGFNPGAFRSQLGHDDRAPVFGGRL